jgi:hypothetical protein
MTGIATNKDLLGAKSDERPNYILNNLGDLFIDYPSAKHKKQSVIVGSSEVELIGNRLLLTAGNPQAIDTIRAATDLVWSSGRPIYGLQVDAKVVGN